MALDGLTHIRESFEPENQNPEEMQRAGWQAILDSFRDFVERKLYRIQPEHDLLVL